MAIFGNGRYTIKNPTSKIIATIPTLNGLYQILTTKAELSLKPKQAKVGKMVNTEKQAEPTLAWKPQPHSDKSRNHTSTNSESINRDSIIVKPISTGLDKNQVNGAKYTHGISYKRKNAHYQKQMANNQIGSQLTNPGAPSYILDEGEKGILTQYPRCGAETKTKAKIESKSNEATSADDVTCNDKININNPIQHLMGNSKICTK